MGVYLLNLSVDAPDTTPAYLPEDLSINDQESLVELILEQVLGFEDAIAEYDDHDTEDYQKKSTDTLDPAVLYRSEWCLGAAEPSRRRPYPTYNDFLTPGHPQRTTPPPKS
ncbi:hypothetical protein SAMN05421823_104575 [Catalinimonas alkaloidigena]|uniref:Uncharacterized protein n=2 Tax=Catalinimonas alkaloidigena TaxID=1075417 RepID=A0A1G9HXT8_9BACT|nr:hypothetical protein SAMN05421823_104575 [Catalinimonas alkaloidigena]